MRFLENFIEEYRRTVEDEIVSAEAAARKLNLLISLKQIKNKRLKGEKLTEKDIQRAMNLLCWSNLAGCCAPAKDCPFHKAVCDTLGLNPEDVWKEKKKRWASIAA